MNKLTPTNRLNPCTLCGDRSRDCRTSNDNLILCHGYIEQDSPISGWKWTKTSSNGVWGVHILDDGKTFDREQWEQDQLLREQQKLDRLNFLSKNALPASERNTYYHKLSKYLGLEDHHRRDLEKRGLSKDNIDSIPYFSVNQFSSISIDIPHNLPGIATDYSTGTPKLCVRESGYFCPSFDINGHVNGGQVRYKGEKNKYRWLKGVFSSHLPNGELPITLIKGNRDSAIGNASTSSATSEAREKTIAHCPLPVAFKTLPVASKTSTIYLTEGISKPLIAALRLGINVCGAAGGHFLGSQSQFKEIISHYTTVIIAVDAGDVVNPHVMKRWEKLINFLRSLGIEPQILWWNQTTKQAPDIDELTFEEFERANCLSVAQFYQLSGFKPNQPSVNRKVNRFRKVLTRQVKRLQKRLNKFVTSIEALEFDGNREKLWLHKIKEGKVVLDASFMGDGKSHAVANLENSQGKIWYVSQSHRNPTVEAIVDQFTDLMPRSQYGFHRTDNGELKEADDETPKELLEVQPNCIRANLFNNLSNLGYNPNEKGYGSEDEGLNPICGTCPLAKSCAFTEGLYRYERRQTLSQPKIRCDIRSMPRDYDYSNDIIIVDEPSQSIKPTKQVTTNWGKLLLELDRVREVLPKPYYEVIDKLLQLIKPLWYNKEYYGLKHQSILDSVPFLPVNLLSIIEQLEQNPLDLKDVFSEADQIEKNQFTPQEWAKYREAVRLANKYENAAAYSESLDNLAKVPPNALIHLLKGLAGEQGVSLRITKGNLQIILDTRNDFAFLNDAKGLIFLDGTLDSERLKYLTGIERPIEVVKKKINQPLQNLTVYVIKTEGIGSKQVSDTAINRIRALSQTLVNQFGDMPTIAHKSMLERLDLDGYWFRDNRGSNEFEGNPNLMAIGLPYPNVGALEDEYLALNGSLEDFEEFYQQRVNDEVLQLGGRQRVNRYPDSQFNLFMMVPPDADLKWLSSFGASVIEVNAVEICDEAGDRFQTAILNMARAVMETGESIISGLARAMGISRQAIHKLLNEHGLTFQQILERVSKYTCKPSLNNPNKGQLTPNGLVSEFGDLLNLDLVTLAKEVINAISVLGWDDFLRYLFDGWSEPLQCRVLGLLWGVLDRDEEGSEIGSS